MWYLLKNTEILPFGAKWATTWLVEKNKVARFVCTAWQWCIYVILEFYFHETKQNVDRGYQNRVSLFVWKMTFNLWNQWIEILPVLCAQPHAAANTSSTNFIYKKELKVQCAVNISFVLFGWKYLLTGQIWRKTDNWCVRIDGITIRIR